MYEDLEHQYDFSLTDQFDYWKNLGGIDIEAIEAPYDLKQKEPYTYAHRKLAFIQIIDSEIYCDTPTYDLEFSVYSMLYSLKSLINKEEHNVQNVYFV